MDTHPVASRDYTQEEEWLARCELAACYQLVDLYGLSDMAGTHISVRLPDDQHHFLINRYGLFFDEITASSLLKVDLDGRVLDGDPEGLNPAGFVIHSAIHMSHPDMACVLHTHTRAGNAIAMQKNGLLPLSQKAMTLLPFLRYHDYEGAALAMEERERIVRDLGPDGRILVLRNHGVLTVGRTIGEAFVWMHRFETACRYQVDGLAGGQELNWLPDEVVAFTREQGRRILGPGGLFESGKLEWPALLRKLERERGNSYRS
jgi:ribulose-5-phosphate 4-epimerase/fuculose-1-phosphate aldolase